MSGHDIKGEKVREHGYKGEIEVHPMPEVLPGERGGQWRIVDSPGQPYCDFINRQIAIDKSDTPAGQRGRFHEFHHAAYTESAIWDREFSGSRTILQKIEDAHIQSRAVASGFEGYQTALYSDEDWKAYVESGACSPERIGASLIALIGTGDFAPALAAVRRLGAETKLATRFKVSCDCAEATSKAFASLARAGRLDTLAAIKIAKGVDAILAKSTQGETPEPPKAQAPTSAPEDTPAQGNDLGHEEDGPKVPTVQPGDEDAEGAAGQPEDAEGEAEGEAEGDGADSGDDSEKGANGASGGPGSETPELEDGDGDEGAEVDWLESEGATYSGTGWSDHGIREGLIPDNLRDLEGLPRKVEREAGRRVEFEARTREAIRDERLEKEDTEAYSFTDIHGADTTWDPEAGEWFSVDPVTAGTERAEDRAAAFRAAGAQHRGAPTSAAYAEMTAAGRTISLQWGDTVLHRPPMPKRWPGEWKRRNPSHSDHGTVPTAMHRLLVDQKVFSDSDRNGGHPTILVDLSGSMSLSKEQVVEICRANPYATIAVYSGTCNVGIIRIIVDRGRVVDYANYFDSPSGGGNTIDGTALRWLAKQSAPRVWVSDGGVFPSTRREGKMEELHSDVRDTVREGAIKQLHDPSSVRAYLLELTRRGKVFLRVCKRVNDPALQVAPGDTFYRGAGGSGRSYNVQIDED